MASFESLDNETYSAARKQDDQWVASITPADFFIDNKQRVFEDDKRHAHSTDIATMTSSYLRSL